MDKKKKIEALSQKLADGVRDTFESNRFKQYLKAVSRFYQYSPRNAALIFFQKPDATYVAGYDTWKKLGRYVRRGETGISIFAPVKVTEKIEKSILDDNGKSVFDGNSNVKKEVISEDRIRFHPVTVFDISQTDGEPLPALCNELQSAVPDFQKIFMTVQTVCPYKIVFENMPGDEKGYCSHTEKKIALRPGMGDAQIVKTLIHEYAHAMLHGNTGKSRKQKEIEAESIAFLVSDFLGIDTSGYSFDYVSVWGYGMDTGQLQETLADIQNSANDIIDRVDTAMKSLDINQERKPMKLPERLSKAAKMSEQRKNEKEMIPNGKVIAQ